MIRDTHGASARFVRAATATTKSPTPVLTLSAPLFLPPPPINTLACAHWANKHTAYYTETLKFQKKFKVRVAGDSKSSDTALCIGYKPDLR